MGRDAAPVLQPSKRVLNLVMALINLGVVGDDVFAITARWDAKLIKYFDSC